MIQKINTDIAFLRAFAVLVVIGYHFFPSYIPWGFVGVDIFFVISGFLMVKIWCDGTSVLNFYINRFRRIYPALLFLLLAVNATGFVVLLNDEYQKLLESSVASLLQVQNVRELLEGGYFTDAVNFRPLLHIWSLSLEFQFYFMLPVLFLACKYLKFKQMALVVIIGLLSFMLCMVATELLHADAYFITPLRIWEFLAGGFCFFMLNRHSNKELYGLVFLILAGFFISMTMLFVRSGGLYPGWLSIAPVLAASCYILSGKSDKLSGTVHKYILYIASISYSLYLFHFPVVEFLKQIYGSPTVTHRLLALVLIFVGAHFVDRRFVPSLLKCKNNVAILFLGSLLTLVSLLIIKHGLENHQRMVMLLNPVNIVRNTFNVDYREDCKFLGLPDNKEDRCRIKNIDGAGPNIVLFGDSQSNALTTVFDELAMSTPFYGNYLQIGRGLCPGVSGIGGDDCNIFVEEAISYIEKLEPTIPVFLAAQWPLYIKTDDLNKTKTFIQSLDSTLRRIGANGRKVIFVYNVPLGALPRTCLARHPWSKVGDCNIPKENADARDGLYRGIVDDTLKKYEVLKYDPKFWMCNTSNCLVYSSGDVMYLDDSHISRQGGSELARRSSEWFSNFIK